MPTIPSVKNRYCPLILLAGTLIAGAATAQQGGVTVLRGESSDQLRQATPDTGIRRAPPASATPARPSGPAVTPAAPIARDGSGNGMVPAATPSEMSQALSSPKALSAGEAAALAAAFKAV